MAYTPYSYVQLKADGATTNFPFNFPYLDTAHIQVSVDTVVTDFTWVDSYTIKTASAPVAGAVVEIRRITPKDSAIVSFQDGSTLLEADLDLMVTYNLYCAQEAYDGTQASIHLTADGVWDGQGVRATDFADPSNAQDLVTLNYMNVNFKNQMLAIEQDSIDKIAVSQAAANTSESNAAVSASQAAASQFAASASQLAAKASEASAATSEQQAAGYAASLKLPSAVGEALRLLRQNSGETGLEYGPVVQTDVLDATLGALMTVGGFGVGSPQGLPLIADIDTMNTPPGIYKWQNGTGTAPSIYGVVIVCGHNGNTDGNNWAFQLFFSTDQDVSWRSSINLAAWGAWNKLWDSKTLPLQSLASMGFTGGSSDSPFMETAAGVTVPLATLALASAKAAPGSLSALSATSGIFHDPNTGLIIQIGYTSGSSSTWEVTFPETFPNACLGLSTGWSPNVAGQPRLNGWTSSGFTVYPASNVNAAFSYIAIGY